MTRRRADALTRHRKNGKKSKIIGQGYCGKESRELLGQRYLAITPQVGEQITQQVVEQIKQDLFSVPWGHHMLLIDKFKNSPEKALFFVHQTVENGWSRNMLLNFMGTDLYERQGKALTNFQRTLPEETSDLARELTKDPDCLSARRKIVFRHNMHWNQAASLWLSPNMSWKSSIQKKWKVQFLL